jgi:hypothetical protein
LFELLFVSEPFLCVIDDATAIGEIEGSRIYRINNVIFFSLTSSKYDQITENGSSFIQLRDLSSINLDGTQDQFETIRHPCSYLVFCQIISSFILIL